MSKEIDLSGKLKKNSGAQSSRFVRPGDVRKPETPAPMFNVREGQMPLPVGVPLKLDKSRLLKKEIAILEAAGWQEGDPIPENAAAIVAAAKKSATDLKSMPLPVAPDSAPLKMPQEKALSDMPADYIEGLMKTLKDAKEAEANKEEAVDFATLHPSLQRAITGSVDLELEPEPEPEVKKAPQPVHELGDHPTHCARCSFPYGQKDDVEVTEEDKRTYVAAWLGGLEFVKSYSVLGGAAKITFRNLTLSESDLCYEQAVLDRDRGLLPSPNDFWDTVLEYRVALSIIELKSASGAGTPFDLPQSIEDWEDALERAGISTDKETYTLEGRKRTETAIAGIHKFVTENVLPRESMFRVVWNKFQDFGRLVAKLDTLATVSENF